MKRFLAIIMLVVGLATAANAATVAASFPGGEEACKEYLDKTVKYPVAAIENGIEGTVTVLFTVKTDGSIGNIKIKRMIDPDLEAEAIRVVKSMPAWTPATTDGKAVESTAEISIPFRLK